MLGTDHICSVQLITNLILILFEIDFNVKFSLLRLIHLLSYFKSTIIVKFVSKINKSNSFEGFNAKIFSLNDAQPDGILIYTLYTHDTYTFYIHKC